MSESLNGQLHLVNSLGMRVSVNVENEQDAFTKMRALGRSGWGPLEVPTGGFKLPLALHDKFDWSLIGAFPLTIEGERGVMFQGHFYKQRVFEEQTKGKKLPASVKYSRGATKVEKAMGIAEEGSGESAYVALITFRGNGKSIAQFEIPANQPRPAEQQRQEPQDAAPPPAQTAGENAALRRHLESIDTLIHLNGFKETDVKRLVRDVTHGKTNDFWKIAIASEAAQVRTRLANARKAS